MNGNFGAHLLPGGQTRFRLWAPDVAEVSVEIDGAPTPMQRDDHGVFEATVPAAAGSKYRYRIAPDLAVPDPASRLQAGDVHDASVVTDPAYPWQHRGWRGRPWAETVIYELHPGTSGGFSGIEQQLPRLAALGITAIELMPIADFPGRHNWGYDGVLPYAPDTAYGTPEDLKHLIDTAHGLNLQVFLDVVYNHFGPDGNYLNAYASSFFRADQHTPWGNAIDFRRAEVRAFFIENALYWLNDFRFDGLRFDAVHAIEDDRFLADLAATIRKAIPNRHIHLILENENNDSSLLRGMPAEQKFDAQWTDDWHHCAHVLLTGESEGYYGDFANPAEQMVRCLAEGFAYQGEPSAHADGAPRGTPSAHLPPTAFVICLQNHDQIGNRAMGDRLTTLADPEALRAAAALLLLTPQIPMIFAGEEWGSKTPFLFFTDHNKDLGKLVTEGRRKEFAHFAAFSNPATREKIPDPNAPETFHASVALPPKTPTAEEQSWLDLYSACLNLRAAQIVPFMSGCNALGAQALSPAAIRAAWRLNNGAILTLASNFGAAPVSCQPGAETLLFTTGSFANHTLPGHTTCAWITP
jgi:maltooligosyltrehalose trehalohydrolase